jgi:rubrerythrin
MGDAKQPSAEAIERAQRILDAHFAHHSTMPLHEGIARALQDLMDERGKAVDDMMRSCELGSENLQNAYDALEERAEKAEAKLDASAAVDAFNAIAALLGCPEWDYPGQLVRDVRALKDRAVKAEADVKRLGELDTSYPHHLLVRSRDDARDWARRWKAFARRERRIARPLGKRCDMAEAAKPEPPCHGCGSTTADGSACPMCGKVFCQSCAEAPSFRGYASCCDAPSELTALQEVRALHAKWAAKRRSTMPIAALTAILTKHEAHP